MNTQTLYSIVFELNCLQNREDIIEFLIVKLESNTTIYFSPGIQDKNYVLVTIYVFEYKER